MKDIRIVRSVLVLIVASICVFPAITGAQSDPPKSDEGIAGEPYPNMPSIPPIGVRTGKYFDVPASSQGPAVDPAKGYRLQDFGSGLYMITDNQIQSMFLVYDRGVVVMDAPQSYAAHIRQAIAEVGGDKPITHLIYSHFHADHIGGAKALGDVPIIIAQEETLRLLRGTRFPTGPCPPLLSKTNTHSVLETRCSSLPITAPGTPQETSSFTHRNSGCSWSLTPPGWMPWRRLPLRKTSLTHLNGSRTSEKWIGIP